MILLTHFSGDQFYLNAEIIQSVEATPDTVITLVNNQKLLVKEKADIVVAKIIEYQKIIRNPEIRTQGGEP